MTTLGWVHDPGLFVAGLVCVAAVANLAGLVAAIVWCRTGGDLRGLYAWSVAGLVGLATAFAGVSVLALLALKKGILIVVVTGVWWLPLAAFLSVVVVRRRAEVPFWPALALGSLGTGAWISVLVVAIYGIEATPFTLLGKRVLLLAVAVVALVAVAALLRSLPAHRSPTIPRRWLTVAVVVGLAVALSAAMLFPQVPVGTSYPAQPSTLTNETAAAHAAAYEEVQILAHGAPGTAQCSGRPVSDSTVADALGFPWVSNGSTIHYARVDCDTHQDPAPHYAEDGWTRSYSKFYFVNETITEDLCYERERSPECPVEHRYQ